MIKLPITTKQTYQVPAMSVVVITPKRSFLASAGGSKPLDDFDDVIDIYDEDF